MSKSTRSDSDLGMEIVALTVEDLAASVQDPELEQMVIADPTRVTEYVTDDEWVDVEVTDQDLALIEWLLVSVARDDVGQVRKIAGILPHSHLSLDTLSFRDNDSDLVYSLLGLANSLDAKRVAEYLLTCGLRNDVIDETVTVH